MIFDLVLDFFEALDVMPPGHSRYRLLKLLDEAVRREIHFIAEHRADYPQGLFQSVWNTAWWYDSAGAAAYYEPPDGGWPEQGPPWRTTEQRISSLMERWYETMQRENRTPVWIRSRLPPITPLGSCARVFRHAAKEVVGAAFLPGEFRIVSSDDAAMMVWLFETAAIHSRFQIADGTCTCIASSIDGRLLAAGGRNGSVSICETDSGRLIRRFHDDTSHVESVTFSADRRRMFTTSLDYTARLYDLHDGRPSIQLGGHQGRVTGAVFLTSPDMVVTSGYDGTVRRWDPASGTELHRFQAHDSHIWQLAVSNDGRLLITASEDETIRIWDADDKEVRRLRGHTLSVTRLAVSNNGRWLASGSDDATVRVWDLRDGSPLFCFEGHEDRITQVGFSFDDRFVISSATDGTVRVWDTTIAAQPYRRVQHYGLVPGVAFLNSGDRIVTGGFDSREGDSLHPPVPDRENKRKGLLIWDLAENTVRALSCPAEVTAIACSPLGKRVAAAANESHTVRMWDAASGNQIFSVHTDATNDLVFSIDGRFLCGSNLQEPRVWNAYGRPSLWYTVRSKLFAGLPFARPVLICRILRHNPFIELRRAVQPSRWRMEQRWQELVFRSTWKSSPAAFYPAVWNEHDIYGRDRAQRNTLWAGVVSVTADCEHPAVLELVGVPAGPDWPLRLLGFVRRIAIAAAPIMLRAALIGLNVLLLMLVWYWCSPRPWWWILGGPLALGRILRIGVHLRECYRHFRPGKCLSCGRTMRRFNGMVRCDECDGECL